MPEHQNIEYKSSWHDDYLKWVCGFANAQGGIINGHIHQNREIQLLLTFVLKADLLMPGVGGTIRIIDTCKQAELPEPELTERDGGFLVTLFKNKPNLEYLSKFGLNERQLKAFEFVKENGKISNTDFRVLYNVSKATATRDLTELVEKFELFEKIGQTGVGTVYVLKGS